MGITTEEPARYGAQAWWLNGYLAGVATLQKKRTTPAGSLPPIPCGSCNCSLDVSSPPLCETPEALQAGGQRIAASGEDSLRH